MAIAFDNEGEDVVGYDIDEEKIGALQRGENPTGEVSNERIRQSNVSFSADPRSIEECEYVIITVPTPIDEWKRPDLRTVASAGETVGEHLSPGATVVLESTVYPGATREVLVPALEERSDLTAGTDFSVGYSPERIDPGTGGDDFRHTVKIVSGQDERTLRELVHLYETVIEAGVYAAPSIETAEAAKCLENVQRDVNIALVNEFAMGCRELDFDLNPYSVLAAARTKWNFHNYRPGLVGGHCIPVDPYFLISRFEQSGFDPDLMRSARKTNDSFPKFIAETLVEEALHSRRDTSSSSVRGGRADGNVSDPPRVLILGLAYKPNTGDVRNEALKQLISELELYDFEVLGTDPHVEDDLIESHFGISAVNDPVFSEFDSVVITTMHDEFESMNVPRPGEEGDTPVVVDLSSRSIPEPATGYKRRYQRA